MNFFVLGPAGTNGHEAARLVLSSELQQFQFGATSYEIAYCGRNPDILRQAEQEESLGVVPIENSSAGLVADVVKGYWLKVLGEPTLNVIGEIQLPIEHHLLVHPSVSDIAELTSVMSHPQALEQCAMSLSGLGLDRRTPASSTAGAAQYVSQDETFRTVGALASRFAAETYGLKVLRDNLQDSIGNATRFHIVGPRPMAPTGNDRTALIFWVPNEPGALVNMLECIRMGRVNMTTVHSIPLGSPGEYAFYVEFECHQFDTAGQRVFQRLRSLTDRLLILGSFPRNIPDRKGS